MQSSLCSGFGCGFLALPAFLHRPFRPSIERRFRAFSTLPFCCRQSCPVQVAVLQKRAPLQSRGRSVGESGRFHGRRRRAGKGSKVCGFHRFSCPKDRVPSPESLGLRLKRIPAVRRDHKSCRTSSSPSRLKSSYNGRGSADHSESVHQNLL